MVYHIATVWVEGGRLPDGVIYREIVRLVAESPHEFQALVYTWLEPRFHGDTSVVRFTFGPISVAKNQRTQF